MIRTVTTFILAILISLPTIAQPKELVEDDVEVGIFEKLGDTIPLDLMFYNESNKLVALKDVIKKPTILSLVYFDCPGICSPLMSGISDVVDKVGMELGEDYQVVTISFNTSDSPEKAIQKKQNFVTKISKENQAHWQYFTGDQDNINAITHAVGYKYKKQGVDFAHPGVLIILSPEGKITRYLYGTSYLPFDVKMALIEAQKGLSRPSINKVLEYCFAYDPAGRTYTLQITRIVGALIVGVALVVFIILLVMGRRRKLVNKK